ncbi:protein kinase [Nocardia sp. NPDC058705]|uniref:protein kinase domain-containing protein n=1 Tax=Nocardia sp. NPDC058705 TaxID=3346609 RepID=UPI003695A4CF
MAEVTRLDNIEPERHPTGPQPTRVDPATPQWPTGAGDPTHRPPRTRVDAVPAPVTDAAEPAYLRERLPPTLAARYSMERELDGSGSEGSVYLCADARGNQFAIKLYRRPPKYHTEFDAPEYRANFAHAHTVQVFERDVDQGVHYEVMEYCAAGTLEIFIVGQAAPALARAILTELNSALAGFQGGDRSPSLVHGDLKPKNVLVRTRAPLDLVLADFGLVADLGDRSRMTNLGPGTVAYNAPELMRYKTPAADWWSLGMIIYQVLVGRAFFQRDATTWFTDREIEAFLLSHDVSLEALDLLPAIGPELSRWQLLLAGLLTRDPERRWATTQVSSWLAGETPPIFRSVDTDHTAATQAGQPRASQPFPIPGVGEFYDAGELGAAMAAHSGNAARAVTGPNLKRLVTWLTTEALTGQTYPELVSHGQNWGPDELVTFFVARLAPEVTLTYRHVNVHTPADLRAIAGSADASVRKSLYQHELLGCLATTPARNGYRMIDANWHDIVAAAHEMASVHSVPLDEAGNELIMARGLLLAAGDESVVNSYVDQVAAQVARADSAVAREIGWFDTLHAQARL